MPNAIDVNPKDWTEVTVLYDDGIYSLIWGRFRKHKLKSLGARWNGRGSEKGYPSLGAYPLWYREPEFLIVPTLKALLEKYQGLPQTPEHEARTANLWVALREAENQGTGLHGSAVLI